MGLILFLIICLAGIVMLQFGFIFILLVLMPTIVAFYTDTDRKRSVFQIVGCGNIAAALPTLVPMIEGALHMKRYDAESVITDPSVWMFIYLGAAAGWGMIYLCRYISRFVVVLTYEFNVNNLQKQQKQLVEEWGEEISESLEEESEEEDGQVYA